MLRLSFETSRVDSLIDIANKGIRLFSPYDKKLNGSLTFLQKNKNRENLVIKVDCNKGKIGGLEVEVEQQYPLNRKDANPILDQNVVRRIISDFGGPEGFVFPGSTSIGLYIQGSCSFFGDYTVEIEENPYKLGRNVAIKSPLTASEKEIQTFVELLKILKVSYKKMESNLNVSSLSSKKPTPEMQAEAYAWAIKNGFGVRLFSYSPNGRVLIQEKERAYPKSYQTTLNISRKKSLFSFKKEMNKLQSLIEKNFELKFGGKIWELTASIIKTPPVKIK
ncbi:hypothetical protein HY643_01600 [Candidatus Woesearchaeota archaeon]|nr:hypothetical protein [Candidatus Woesearchaeota archaeon]